MTIAVDDRLATSFMITFKLAYYLSLAAISYFVFLAMQGEDGHGLLDPMSSRM